MVEFRGGETGHHYDATEDEPAWYQAAKADYASRPPASHQPPSTQRRCAACHAPLSLAGGGACGNTTCPQFGKLVGRPLAGRDAAAMLENQQSDPVEARALARLRTREGYQEGRTSVHEALRWLDSHPPRNVHE